MMVPSPNEESPRPWGENIHEPYLEVQDTQQVDSNQGYNLYK